MDFMFGYPNYSLRPMYYRPRVRYQPDNYSPISVFDRWFDRSLPSFFDDDFDYIFYPKKHLLKDNDNVEKKQKTVESNSDLENKTDEMKLKEKNEETAITPFNNLQDLAYSPFSSFFKYQTPSWHLSQTENQYIVKADVPGVTKDDIKLSIDEGYLKLSGERKFEENKDNCKTCSSSKFERYLRLPNYVDPNKMTAELKNGVLTINIDKKEQKEVEEITITEPQEQKEEMKPE